MHPAAPAHDARADAHVTVKDLTMAYGERVIMKDLDFAIARGDVFVIMGGSGCGKSTLLRHLIGLLEPAKGEVFHGATSFTRARSLPSTLSPLRIAAPTMIAVPCWSSWNTGMLMRARSFDST